MVTSSNGNIFRDTGPLSDEFTGHRWIPLTKASEAELWCFLWCAPWINNCVYNREAGELRRHRAHYDITVMECWRFIRSMQKNTHQLRQTGSQHCNRLQPRWRHNLCDRRRNGRCHQDLLQEHRKGLAGSGHRGQNHSSRMVLGGRDKNWK